MIFLRDYVSNVSRSVPRWGLNGLVQTPIKHILYPCPYLTAGCTENQKHFTMLRVSCVTHYTVSILFPVMHSYAEYVFLQTLTRCRPPTSMSMHCICNGKYRAKHPPNNVIPLQKSRWWAWVVQKTLLMLSSDSLSIIRTMHNFSYLIRSTCRTCNYYLGAPMLGLLWYVLQIAFICTRHLAQQGALTTVVNWSFKIIVGK